MALLNEDEAELFLRSRIVKWTRGFIICRLLFAVAVFGQSGGDASQFSVRLLSFVLLRHS